MWILAAELPNSDLNFAVDFFVDFFLLFSKEKGPKKSTKKSPAKFTQDFVRKNSPRILQKPFLDYFSYFRPEAQNLFCSRPTGSQP